MNIRLLIFISLLISRIFITPVWFSLHVEEVKDASETFEQVRLKKRRSSFIEEDYFREATLGIAVEAIVSKRVKLAAGLLKRLLPAFSYSFTTALGNFLPTITTESLFLRHRVLRI